MLSMITLIQSLKSCLSDGVHVSLFGSGTLITPSCLSKESCQTGLALGCLDLLCWSKAVVVVNFESKRRNES